MIIKEKRKKERKKKKKRINSNNKYEISFDGYRTGKGDKGKWDDITTKFLIFQVQFLEQLQ